MIKANFTSATDNSGQTGRYPVSIEVLNLLQEQSVFISKTFGAMFGRDNLILKVPTETEDGLCLWEGELVPIDHRASTYPSGGGSRFSIAFQKTQIPNFKEDIQISGETFLQARQMTKAFIYSISRYGGLRYFEQSEEAQRVGAFFNSSQEYGICSLREYHLMKETYRDAFLDVTEFINNLPEIMENSRKVEQLELEQERLLDDFNEFEPRLEGVLTDLDKKLSQKSKEQQDLNDERFGLLYALILNLYKSLRNQIGAGFDQYLDSKYQEAYGSAILPEDATRKYFEELKRNAEHI